MLSISRSVTLVFSLLLLAAGNLVLAASPGSPQPLVFEPNLGQSAPATKWIAHGPGYELSIGEDAATLTLLNRTDPPFSRDHIGSSINSKPAIAGSVNMRMKGSAQHYSFSGIDPTGGYSNYLFGNDPRAWHTHIPHYAAIKASHVYPGIDLVFYSRNGELEYDFLVGPAANPKQIQLAFDGVDRMDVDHANGDLLLTTAQGAEMRHRLPKIY
jgi:hypothetical protein